MRKLLCLSFLSFLLIFSLLLTGQSVNAQDEPYAPVFSIPEDIEGAEFYQQQQGQVQNNIPSRSEVHVPPYPGAVVFMVHTTDQVKQVIGKDGFAEIKLVTTDPIEKIVQFYKEHLPDWSYHEDYSIFWYGEDEFSLARLMEGMPNITIQEATPVTQRLIPDATYMIGIIYETE